MRLKISLLHVDSHSHVFGFIFVVFFFFATDQEMNDESEEEGSGVDKSKPNQRKRAAGSMAVRSKMPLLHVDSRSPVLGLMVVLSFCFHNSSPGLAVLWQAEGEALQKGASSPAPIFSFLSVC